MISKLLRRWVMSQIAIEAVQVLQIQRSDVLVMRVARRLQPNEYSHLVQLATKYLPFVRVLILDHDVSLEVVKKAKSG